MHLLFKKSTSIEFVSDNGLLSWIFATMDPAYTTGGQQVAYYKVTAADGRDNKLNLIWLFLLPFLRKINFGPSFCDINNFADPQCLMDYYPGVGSPSQWEPALYWVGQSGVAMKNFSLSELTSALEDGAIIAGDTAKIALDLWEDFGDFMGAPHMIKGPTQVASATIGCCDYWPQHLKRIQLANSWSRTAPRNITFWSNNNSVTVNMDSFAAALSIAFGFSNLFANLTWSGNRPTQVEIFRCTSAWRTEGSQRVIQNPTVSSIANLQSPSFAEFCFSAVNFVQQMRDYYWGAASAESGDITPIMNAIAQLSGSVAQGFGQLSGSVAQGFGANAAAHEQLNRKLDAQAESARSGCQANAMAVSMALMPPVRWTSHTDLALEMKEALQRAFPSLFPEDFSIFPADDGGEDDG